MLVLVGGPLSEPIAAAAPATGWLAAQLIETGDMDPAYPPQIAVDGNGNAVAVWPQYDSLGNSVYKIWADLFTPGSGWGTATIIEVNSSGDAIAPQVVFDGRGDAVAVWEQYDGVSTTQIWANQHKAGSGWGTATIIETDPHGAASAQLASDGNGTVVAVWQQSDGIRPNIWSNRYTASSGWGAAALIETATVAAMTPQVAMSGNGSALALWTQTDTDLTFPFPYLRNDIWVNHYTPGAGWENSALIETNTSGPAGAPDAGFDPSGNAVAVWEERDASRYNIWANRYAAGSGWGNATLIETDNAGPAYLPQVAVDKSGNAVAVWQQSNGTRYDVRANRYAPGSGWGNATPIETDNAGDALAPQVAVDGSGDFVAVWYQSDGTRNNILANRYAPGSGWGNAALIETNDAGAARYAQVAANRGGDAFAVWVQAGGGIENVWANRFVAPDNTPPSIVLTAPASGTVTNASSIWVAGTTEVGAQVSVDGVAATVAPDGSFGLLVALRPGANVLVAEASDDSGNARNTSVSVTFQDPAAALAAQLFAAQSDLALAQARVAAVEAEANATQASLASAQANLTAAQARVSVLEADGNATQAELASATANVTAARATVVSLEASASATRADLNASRADLLTAAASLAVAQARVAALEAQANATRPGGGSANTPSAGAGGTLLAAVVIAAVGIAVGASGVVMGLRSKRRENPEGAGPASAPAPKEPEPK